MNYFEYNALQLRSARHADSRGEELDCFGAGTMEVDEDYTCTVDDVRAYIRAMHDQRSGLSADAMRFDGQDSQRAYATVALRSVQPV